MAVTFKIVLEGLVQTSRTMNVFYYHDAAAETPASLAQLVQVATSFNTTMVPAYQVNCSNDATFFNIRVQELMSAGGEGVPIDFAITAIGSVDVEALPASVACVMKRATPLSSRNNRGRIYIPGIPIDALDHANGRWTAIFLLAVNTSFQAMLTPLTTLSSTAVPIIYNHATAPGTVDKIVTIIRVNEVPRNQRRRQPDRGM